MDGGGRDRVCTDPRWLFCGCDRDLVKEGCEVGQQQGK